MFDDFECLLVTETPPRWKHSRDPAETPVDATRLASLWIQEEQFRQAHPHYECPDDWEWDTPQDALSSLTYSDPEMAWRVIKELAATAPEEVLPIVGIGPLETFLFRHAETFIDQIEGQAAHDPKFRFCLYEARPAFGGPMLFRLARAIGLDLPQ